MGGYLNRTQSNKVEIKLTYLSVKLRRREKKFAIVSDINHLLFGLSSQYIFSEVFQSFIGKASIQLLCAFLTSISFFPSYSRYVQAFVRVSWREFVSSRLNMKRLKEEEEKKYGILLLFGIVCNVSYVCEILSEKQIRRKDLMKNSIPTSQILSYFASNEAL